MIDQTRVQSGFDVEVLLGSRYLQYLLLLATEIGEIPVKASFGDPEVIASLLAPLGFDRTYQANANVDQLVESNRDDPFGVDVLVNDPGGADVRVTLRMDLSKPSTGEVAFGLDLQLFVRLRLETETEEGGGLARIAISSELVDVAGTVVDLAAKQTPPIPKSVFLDRLAPTINRTIDLGGVGSAARLESFAIRKHAAADGLQAAFGIYLNLRLRNGPQPDRFISPRGDVSAALNFLPTDTDVALASRADLYGDLGPDARFRRAEPDGDGFSFPLRRHFSDGTTSFIGELLDVTVRPPQPSDDVRPDPHQPRQPGGPQPPPPSTEGGYLTFIVHGNYEIDIVPDPDYRIYMYVFHALDEEGILTWNSDTDFEAGILADIFFAIVFAFIPLLGPWTLLIFTGLEIAKEITEKIVAAVGFEDRNEEKLDATLLDVAPNRLTILRRRWDPFYETHHQIGLRPGGVQVNDLGFAMTGKAALTRVPLAIAGPVVRAVTRDEDGTMTGVVYRAVFLDEFLPLKDVVAPGVDRGDFTPPGPTDPPDRFSMSVEEAARRIAAKELERDIPYHVNRIELKGGHTITGLTLISLREKEEIRANLTAAHADAARTRITNEQGADIRAQVIADFEAKGIIATEAQIEAETATRIEALVAADEDAYEKSAQFGQDLLAATDAVITLVLSPNECGILEEAGILVLHDFVAVHIHLTDDTDQWYFRDKYVRSEEPTVAARLADNLRSKPRFHRTADGQVVF